MFGSNWFAIFLILSAQVTQARSLQEMIVKRDFGASKAVAQYLGEPDHNVTIIAAPNWRPGKPLALIVITEVIMNPRQNKWMIVYAAPSDQSISNWKSQAKAAIAELKADTQLFTQKDFSLSTALAERRYQFVAVDLGAIFDQPPKVVNIVENLLAKTAGWQTNSIQEEENKIELSIGAVLNNDFGWGSHRVPILAKGPGGFVRGDGRYFQPTYGTEVMLPINPLPFKHVLVLQEDSFIALEVMAYAVSPNFKTVVTRDGRALASDYFEVHDGESFEEAIERSGYPAHRRRYRPEWKYTIDRSMLGRVFDAENLIAQAEANRRDNTDFSCEKILENGVAK